MPPDIHNPLPEQGFAVQSSVLVWQVVPENGPTQIHKNDELLGVQIASFWQGLLLLEQTGPVVVVVVTVVELVVPADTVVPVEPADVTADDVVV